MFNGQGSGCRSECLQPLFLIPFLYVAKLQKISETTKYFPYFFT